MQLLPPNFASLFGLTGTSLATALSQLSGEAATGAQYGAFELGNQHSGCRERDVILYAFDLFEVNGTDQRALPTSNETLSRCRFENLVLRFFQETDGMLPRRGQEPRVWNFKSHF